MKLVFGRSPNPSRSKGDYSGMQAIDGWPVSYLGPLGDPRTAVRLIRRRLIDGIANGCVSGYWPGMLVM
ncbi:hypothetical protein [Neorhodopirellula lusitana]|uniref:hypothetical protein n=1 Tax=Neorhodopirellula lusitana TaxID=445327 RepID=UPI0024B7FF63|nr:hypothetical protein [Neorhodopirellula lusitana]